MTLREALADEIRSAIERDELEAISEIVSSARAEDLADALLKFDDIEVRRQILEATPENLAGEALTDLPTEKAKELLAILPDPVVARYLDILPMDDAVDMKEEIEAERFDRLLTMIPPEDASEIRRLLSYGENTVGRLMTERFFEAGPETTMADLLADLRQASDEKYESIHDVYVIDGRRHLLGVFSLRRLLRADPSAQAEDVMREDVVVANVNEPAEDAARRMSRYGLYALPCLDERGRIHGIMTGDDAQAILRAEDTRDVLALGGVGGDGESYVGQSVWSLFRRRIPWLLALFVAEFVTGQVMRHYGSQAGTAVELSPLVFFIPLLIGAGGNVGSQVTTTITRALALGEVGMGDALRVMRKELSVAVLIGLCLGLVGFGRAMMWNSGISLSLVVAGALPAIVIWASAVGSLLPLGAKRAGVDPAVMSAPFISTFVDATGLIIYFEIARAILPS